MADPSNPSDPSDPFDSSNPSDPSNPTDPSPATPAHVVLLCGGVGGAKLADGLAHLLAPGALTVIVNTGDDFRRYGLYISPDVDTVLYTLAGWANPATGWGVAGDTDQVVRSLRVLGDDPWFHLGDRDLATHLVRTGALADGATLTQVTARLADALGVGPAVGPGVTVLPMSDDRVQTVIETENGLVPFQEWFVRDRCEPPAKAVHRVGIDGIHGIHGIDDGGTARPTESVLAALAAADLVVLGPSNPYLSIGPILALPGIRALLRECRAPVVAVSPIVGGAALKGPAGAMLRDLAGESSSLAVARLYADFLTGIVIDDVDAALAAPIQSLGIAVNVAGIVMADVADRVRVAGETVAFGRGMAAVL